MLKALTSGVTTITMKTEKKPKPSRWAKQLRALGVVLQDGGERAIVKSREDSYALHGVKTVIRRSGRNTHLSCYLIGIDRRGTRHEVFIDTVPSMLNTITVSLQKFAVKIFGTGLSYKEMYC